MSSRPVIDSRPGQHMSSDVSSLSAVSIVSMFHYVSPSGLTLSLSRPGLIQFPSSLISVCALSPTVHKLKTNTKGRERKDSGEDVH